MNINITDGAGPVGDQEANTLSLEFPEAAFPLKIGTTLVGQSRAIPRPPLFTQNTIGQS